ncbi:MAG: hypothetical protein K0R57_2478 [Paenibacillaceae bacterium]|jgi:AraC-like DNA-binding protein|nr:hypothetical protein [Paenibacillaceae bacterium]
MRLEYYLAKLEECDVDLHYCGYEDTVTDFHIGPNIRDCYLLHYVCRGEGFYTRQGVTHALAAGDVFCIFPDEVVYYYSKPGESWSFYWFSFNGRRASDYAGRAGFTAASPVVRLNPAHRLDRKMDALLELLGREAEPRRLALLGQLYGLLEELEASVTAESAAAGSGKTAHSQYVHKALQYIAFNYHRPLRVTDISGYLGLDRTYFSKLFSQATGIPPQTYILRFRLEKSMPLLTNTDLSLGEICRVIGLEELFYYSRAFKKMTGVSPSEYRKAHASLRG